VCAKRKKKSASSKLDYRGQVPVEFGAEPHSRELKKTNLKKQTIPFTGGGLNALMDGLIELT
jgi:hypothetical protein